MLRKIINGRHRNDFIDVVRLIRRLRDYLRSIGIPARVLRLIEREPTKPKGGNKHGT